MERLKNIKNTIMSCVEGQLSNLESTDTRELGEAIDMIKDLEEAMYYCSIVKAMEKQEDRDMDRNYGRMYYGGDPRWMKDKMIDNSPYHPDTYYPTLEMRDRREGTSPISRKMYMESKEMHKDKEHQMKELEKYIQELTKDLMEMIEGASIEEKQMLQQKIATLANKIQ